MREGGTAAAAGGLRPLTTIISHAIPNHPVSSIGSGPAGAMAQPVVAMAGEGCRAAETGGSVAGPVACVAAGVLGASLSTDGSLRLQLHQPARRQGTRIDSGAVPGRADAGRLRGAVVHPSLEAQALDAGGNGLLAEIDALIAQLPPFSDERDHFSTALYGMSEVLKVDPEGRVGLTESLKAHAGITDAVDLRGTGSQVSDLGALAVPTSSRRGQAKGEGSQEGARFAPRGRATPPERGNDDGSRR